MRNRKFRRNMKPKTASDLRRHFKKRMRQRYGILINRRDIDGIVNTIQSGDSEPVSNSRDSNTRSTHKVEFRGEEMTVVYDKKHSTLATVFPKEDDPAMEILGYVE